MFLLYFLLSISIICVMLGVFFSISSVGTRYEFYVFAIPGIVTAILALIMPVQSIQIKYQCSPIGNIVILHNNKTQMINSRHEKIIIMIDGKIVYKNIGEKVER